MADYVQVSIFVAGRALVDPNTGAPTTEFLRALNTNLQNVKVAVNQVSQQAADITASLEQAGIALTTAQQVHDDLVAATKNQNEVTSYTSPSTILQAQDAGDGTTCNIVVADHNRILGDGTSIAITGATITGLSPSTTYYVFYDDPDHNGGAVSYQTATDASLAGQGNGQFACGDVTTPAIGGTTTDGGGVTPPGTRYKIPNGTQYQ